jgi:hypothetical protein
VEVMATVLVHVGIREINHRVLSKKVLRRG